MNAQDIQKYLRLLGAELDLQGITGKSYWLAGSLCC